MHTKKNTMADAASSKSAPPSTTTDIITNPSGDPLKPIAPILERLTLGSSIFGTMTWFMRHAPKLILLGENNFRFSGALKAMGAPPLLSTEYESVSALETIQRKFDLAPLAVRDQVDATRVHNDVALTTLGFSIYNKQGAPIPKGKKKNREQMAFAWNFPFIGKDEDEAEHEDLILATFLSLALYFVNVTGCRKSLSQTSRARPMFAMALQGDQFSRWSVLRAAGRSGWRLQGWSTFDHNHFPGYHPCRANGDPFPYENGRLYVFELHVEEILL